MSEAQTAPGVFCPLAWTHRFTNIGGEIQVCCTSAEVDNTIRDEHGEKMLAVTVNDNDTIMNSPFMKDLRTQMLAGKWPKPCQRCQVTEMAGGRSRRLLETMASAAEVPALLAATDPDGHIRDLSIRSIDMRLGNTCNLACRMCNPKWSTGWHREWPAVDQPSVVDRSESTKNFGGNEWYKSAQVVEDFKKQLPHLRQINFAGGEPLLVREMQTFLQVCIDSGYAKNIEISYNTNLTVLPAPLKTLWPQFKGVKLLVSVDAYGPLNDYIRHPSKWKILDRHLRDIDTGFDQYGITEVLIMCTVQAYNILHLRPLYDYLALNFARVNRLPHLIDLHFPNFYSTQMLTAELKGLAETRLEEIYKVTQERIGHGLIPAHQKDVAENLLASIQFMKMDDQQVFVTDFLRAAESKDKLRGQNLFSLIPEFRALKTP